MHEWVLAAHDPVAGFTGYPFFGKSWQVQIRNIRAVAFDLLWSTPSWLGPCHGSLLAISLCSGTWKWVGYSRHQVSILSLKLMCWKPKKMGKCKYLIDFHKSDLLADTVPVTLPADAAEHFILLFGYCSFGECCYCCCCWFCIRECTRVRTNNPNAQGYSGTE